MQVGCSTAPMPNNENGRLFEFVFFYLVFKIEVFIDLKWSRDQNYNKGEDQFWIFVPVDAPHGKNSEKIGNCGSNDR